ncbi:hypothetical protein CTA2_3718 [Colletotrichum tanaceti]|nr:hypothetical protein CTA2_3718 [Colletotrichum tanaceti]
MWLPPLLLHGPLDDVLTLHNGTEGIANRRAAHSRELRGVDAGDVSIPDGVLGHEHVEPALGSLSRRGRHANGWLHMTRKNKRKLTMYPVSTSFFPFSPRPSRCACRSVPAKEPGNFLWTTFSPSRGASSSNSAASRVSGVKTGAPAGVSWTTWTTLPPPPLPALRYRSRRSAMARREEATSATASLPSAYSFWASMMTRVLSVGEAVEAGAPMIWRNEVADAIAGGSRLRRDPPVAEVHVELVAGLLNGKGNGQLREAGHVVDGEDARLVVHPHGVLLGVDVRVELAGEAAGDGVPLGGKGGGEAELGVGHVVGAGAGHQLVDARGDVDVLLAQADGPGGQRGVGVGLDEADGLGGVARDKGRHVELEHGADGGALLLLVGGDGLAAQQAALLGGVPVELDGPVPGHVAAGGEHAEGLEDADGAGAVVVGARGRQQREQVVGRVLVGADDGQGLGEVADLGLEAGDDGRLRELVGEVLERDVGVQRRRGDDAGDVVVQPDGARLARRPAVVAVVVARHVPEHVVHLGPVDLGEEGPDEVLMCEFGEVCGVGGAVSRVYPSHHELLEVGDVAELLALAPQTQLVSLRHPLGPGLADDVEEPGLGHLGGHLGLQRDEGVDGVGVLLEGRGDAALDGPRGGDAVRRRRGARGDDDLVAGGAEDELRRAQQEQQLG